MYFIEGIIRIFLLKQNWSKSTLEIGSNSKILVIARVIEYKDMLGNVKNFFSTQSKQISAFDKKKTLSGTLELLTLFDLLLSLNQNGHSGELHISYRDSEASIFLLKGQPCHAFVSGLSGEAALIDIFIKADDDRIASFYFEAANHYFDPDNITIKTKTQELLFKVALELDHHRKPN